MIRQRAFPLFPSIFLEKVRRKGERILTSSVLCWVEIRGQISFKKHTCRFLNMFAINENSETKNKTKTRQVRDHMVLNSHMSVIQYCKNEKFSPICIIEGLRWPPGT